MVYLKRVQYGFGHKVEGQKVNVAVVKRQNGMVYGQQGSYPCPVAVSSRSPLHDTSGLSGLKNNRTWSVKDPIVGKRLYFMDNIGGHALEEYRNRSASPKHCSLKGSFMIRKKITERERISKLLDGKTQPEHGQAQTFFTDLLLAYRVAYPDDLVPGGEIFREVIEKKFHPEKERDAQLDALEKLFATKVAPAKANLVAQLDKLSKEQLERLVKLFPELEQVDKTATKN